MSISILSHLHESQGRPLLLRGGKASLNTPMPAGTSPLRGHLVLKVERDGTQGSNGQLFTRCLPTNTDKWDMKADDAWSREKQRRHIVINLSIDGVLDFLSCLRRNVKQIKWLLNSQEAFKEITQRPVFDCLTTKVLALKWPRVTHWLRMWRGSKTQNEKKPRNDWSEWCVEAWAVDLSATKWLAMAFLCVLRPECILYESPDVLRTHSWVMYQTEQITPLSSFCPLSRGSPPWSYLFANFLCFPDCQVGRCHYLA